VPQLRRRFLGVVNGEEGKGSMGRKLEIWDSLRDDSTSIKMMMFKQQKKIAFCQSHKYS
jgi:hypothetical protein